MKLSRFTLFLAASILTHLSLTGSLWLVSALKNSQPQDNAIELVVIDEKSNEDLVDEKTPQKQIVETDSKNANEQLDQNAKYLSEKNNTVEKETKAQSGDQFKNAQRLGAPVVKATPPKNTSPKPKAEDLLNPSFDPYAALVKKNNKDFENNSKRDPATAKMGAQAGDESTTNDRVEAADDLMTRLNTKEYKYYGYYHRIKLQLNQWWQPKVREKVSKLVSQGRQIASEENKVTRLIIILDNSGQLVKVQVLAESGVRDLDEAAIEAFKSAAPFPNPPKGIIETDGTVRIRWDFVVES